ncbi:MAG: SH3 domain-containing protein [Lachnospiraceae bacterium]|nr:SH3 domain-containing protein [Lachnospiraceae bacterium]
MLKRKAKIAAGVLSTLILITGVELPAYAVELDSILPAAGLSLSLEEGVYVKKVAEDKGLDVQGVGMEFVDPVETSELVKEQILKEMKKDYSNLVIAQVSDYVNVRSLPGEEGQIVGKLYNNSVGEFLEEENGWYKIRSGECTGYVKGEYCVTGEEANQVAEEIGRRIAIVNTETLNVRKEATTKSAIIGQVPKEEVLTVTDTSEGWVQVKVEEGTGYVSEEYVELSIEFTEAESIEQERARLAREEEERRKAREASRKAREAEEAANAGTEQKAVVTEDSARLGQQVADFALQFVGNPYVYGGTSLTNGADCSGFVMSVYANFGVSLPHSANADRKRGTGVASIEEAIPGDIVCYSGHVGIYIGNGQIVHASNSRTGIIISNAHYDRILAVRRIF